MSSMSSLRGVLLLTVSALVASCGGGGSGVPSDLALRISVDGQALATPALVAGDSYEIEVASGSVVELRSDAAVDVRTAAGTAEVVVEAEEPQRHRVRLSAPGGADVEFSVASRARASDAVRVKVKVAPQRFENGRLRVVGQVFRYLYRRLNAAGEPILSQTVVEPVRSVGPVGYSVTTSSYEDPTGTSGSYSYDSFDHDNNYLGFVIVNWEVIDGEYYDEGYRCELSWTGTEQAFPLYVGKRWRTQIEGTCDGYTATVLNEVLSYQTITVPAGTFATLLRRVETTPNSGGKTRTDCWWSVERAVNVRCDEFTQDASDGWIRRGSKLATALPD